MVDTISEHRLEVKKTARYYVLQPEGDVRKVLYAIHGYRQLGRYFIQQFAGLAADGVMVVVPEGLHRFYIEGYSGRVGASWMTVEDRESDIADYCDYLNTLRAYIGMESLPAVLLGFSQGGPTACRWLSASDPPFASLILHSTVFPNDFEFDRYPDKLSSASTYVIFGTHDRFADEETIAGKMAWMRENGIDPKLLRFDGGHEIYLPHVQAIL